MLTEVLATLHFDFPLHSKVQHLKEKRSATMEPNEIAIRRVFVRPAGQLKMDDTLNPAAANEIVVEWEAGATANADTTVNITFQISIWNHTTGQQAVLHAPPAVAPDGHHHSGIYELVVTEPAAGPNLVRGNFYEITTCLYRPNNIVSFYKGPLFHMITP
jgi:hypothetical protein